MNWKNQKITIIGAARSGIAAADKLTKMGASVLLSESKAEKDISDAANLRERFACEFGGHTEKALDADLMIVSPGVPGSAPILKEAALKNIEIISEIELGFRIKHESSRIIAVTGSNGKSTTATLIAHIMREKDFNTILAGNIGQAFTSFPIEEPGIDFIVLEISSFQLEKIKDFRPDVAVLLNITPDHLNRYDSFEHYALTKIDITRNQKKDDFAVISGDDPIIGQYAHFIHSKKLLFSMEKCEKKSSCFRDGEIYFDESVFCESFTLNPKKMNLIGPHNIANVMASVLATLPFKKSWLRPAFHPELIQDAVSKFKPLEHRLEGVRTIGNIEFINDSKATNSDSVRYALQSFEKPIRIIMGGSEKGENYSILKMYARPNVKKAYLIGQTADKIASDLAPDVICEKYNSLKEAVEAAYRDASEGEVVLLSPACASYDMFDNFEDRGRKFKQIVAELSEKE